MAWRSQVSAIDARLVVALSGGIDIGFQSVHMRRCCASLTGEIDVAGA